MNINTHSIPKKTKFKAELLDFLDLRNDKPYYKSYIYKCMKSKLAEYKSGYRYKFPEELAKFLLGDNYQARHMWYISQTSYRRAINERFLEISFINQPEKVIERKLFNMNNLSQGKPVAQLTF